MDHEKLCVALKEMDVPQHLIILIAACNVDRKPLSGQKTEWVPRGKSVRTGAFCLFYLPVCLYFHYMDFILLTLDRDLKLLNAPLYLMKNAS